MKQSFLPLISDHLNLENITTQQSYVDSMNSRFKSTFLPNLSDHSIDENWKNITMSRSQNWSTDSMDGKRY